MLRVDANGCGTRAHGVTVLMVKGNEKSEESVEEPVAKQNSTLIFYNCVGYKRDRLITYFMLPDIVQP